jgi:Arc/MetJ-type ribon-helix-helix transcriptional regulator
MLKPKTIYISSETLEKIGKLVEAGIFPSKAQAIRIILETALPEYTKLLREDVSRENIFTIISNRRWKTKNRGMPIISVKVPPAILDLLEAEKKRTGYSRGQRMKNE